MEVAPINSLLPAEILERIFSNLPSKDLKNVVLVCKWWREVGEAPQLWTWVWLTVNFSNNNTELLGESFIGSYDSTTIKDNYLGGVINCIKDKIKLNYDLMINLNTLFVSKI